MGIGAVLLAIAACEEPPDRPVGGEYRLVSLNERTLPVARPRGGGELIEGGSLWLVRSAASDSQRFDLRFASRRATSPATDSSGVEGTFRMTVDSLLFFPGGRTDRPAVRFRYVRGDSGGIILVDTNGDRWAYRPR